MEDKRKDYELADLQAKVKAIKALIEEWESMLPWQFMQIIRPILENKNEYKTNKT